MSIQTMFGVFGPPGLSQAAISCRFLAKVIPCLAAPWRYNASKKIPADPQLRYNRWINDSGLTSPGVQARRSKGQP